MKIPTLINSSSKINGELIFTTDVRIDGEVFGKVESDKNVIIGAEGFVKGFLRAKDLVVFGRIEGNIIVSGITVLHEHASIFGNLYTKVFEVKDGATITAKVVTYEKLEAIDEAQIHLAEEMIKIEPNRRQIPTYSHDRITFDDAIDFEKENQITDYAISNNKVLQEQFAGDSGDILSKIIEYNSGSEDLIKHKEASAMAGREENIFEPSELISGISGVAGQAGEYSSPLMPEANENKQSADSSDLAACAIEPSNSDLLSETDEITLFEGLEFEDVEKFTLLTNRDELDQSKQQKLDEPFISRPGSTPGSEYNHLLDFDFEGNLPDNGDLVLFPLPAPVSIAGCLGEPVKEDSPKIRKGKKKPYNSDTALTSQAVRKSKSYSLSGFEELRNLLIPVRFHDIKPIEKKSDQEKLNGKKVSENDLANQPKTIDHDDLFLNDAIRHLPVDDYSSLFN